ncbi:uncharacterized protein LOC123721396 [Papilio machaon]|uniref:uncharacterized protein LOC123721396 n=1 Tax=Papilio machaon TaxID=76193 RepID=UPI001E664281|nr:uncharacterized protein LOC123721396 [Papilio machaon]
MEKYILPLLLLAAFVCQGINGNDIWLEDRHVQYISHDYLGTTISIPKFIFDTLRSCHIIYPNGVMYEVFPSNNLPQSNVFFLEAVQPYTSCGVGFRGVGVEFSGTYELLSSVQHVSNNSITLTRQRFHLTVTLPEFTN